MAWQVQAHTSGPVICMVTRKLPERRIQEYKQVGGSASMHACELQLNCSAGNVNSARMRGEPSKHKHTFPCGWYVGSLHTT